jgi:uncharacterized DUF497 family protein
MVLFDWDPAKDRRNRSKHSVSFALASRVFSDPAALMRLDRAVAGEERWHSIGRVDDFVVLSLTWFASRAAKKWSESSARHALKRERVQYEIEAFARKGAPN